MRKRVLLIDDDALLRRSFLRLVTALFEVEANAVESLAALIDLPGGPLAADLIILDINLGVGVPSGLDAYRWLRDAGFAGEVVFLTGHAASHPAVVAAVSLGAARVLEKPIDIAQLRTLLAGPDA